MTIKETIQGYIDALSEGIAEKGEVIAVSLLAALAGQNIFLLGPPGVAKSLMARRLASVFETNSYFEYLMQRFSTPEDMFGPVSIKQLKEDNYVRKTEGYLPAADFAFLDEIWKSNTAVLNTLLTVINEKKFRNGTEIERVPLKTVISASNETPSPGQGLEALYDRFLVRLMVEPTRERENFEGVIQSAPADMSVDLAGTPKIADEHFQAWQKNIDAVKLSAETLAVIHRIRIKIEELNRENEKKPEDQRGPEIYVSDRRWQRAARLLKAGAFFCGRKETNLVDVLLLRHCLWSNDTDRQVLMSAVMSAVEAAASKSGFVCDIAYSELERRKDDIEDEISEILKNPRRKSYPTGLLRRIIKTDVASHLFYGPASSVKILISDIAQTIVSIENKQKDFQQELDSPFVPDNIAKIVMDGFDEQLVETNELKIAAERLRNTIQKAGG